MALYVVEKHGDKLRVLDFFTRKPVPIAEETHVLAALPGKAMEKSFVCITRHIDN